MSKKINRHLRNENKELRLLVKNQEEHIANLEGDLYQRDHDARQAEEHCSSERYHAAQDSAKQLHQLQEESRRIKEEADAARYRRERDDRKRKDAETWYRVTGLRSPGY